MPKEPIQLSELITREVLENLEYFSSLWPGYEKPRDLEAPHRQRTTVNKLRGYALFLGMGDGRQGTGFAGLAKMRRWQKRIGALRDLDVTIQWVEKCRVAGGPRTRPAAKALRELLGARREALRVEIAADARGFQGAQVRLAVHDVNLRFGQMAQALAESPRPFDCSRAFRSVAEPWREGLAVLHGAHGDVVLHAFRVHNKRLRFVLELLALQGKGGDLGAAAGAAAGTSQGVHNCLGILSDMIVLRDALRGARAGWAREGKRLEKAADALEGARLEIEREQFRQWFALWPVISAPEFLAPVEKALGG